MRGLSPELRVIFDEEFRRQIRNRGFVFFTVLILALMLIVIPLTPVVVDLIQDDTADAGAPRDVGAGVLERIGYADPAGILPGHEQQGAPKRYNEPAEGILAVQQGEIDTLFVLTADYLDSGLVEQYWASRESGGRFSGNWAAEGAFRGFLRFQVIGGQVDAAVLARALEPGDYRTLNVADDGSVTEMVPLAQEVGEFMVPTFFGLLLFIAVITGSGTLLRSVAEEKETRMFEMLVTSASPFSVMAGKLLALGLVGLIHIAVWITVGAFAMPAIFDRIPNGSSLTISPDLLVIVALCFVLGYFLFSILALFIAAIVSSAAEGQRQIGLLAVLVGLPVWLTGLIIHQPEGAIAQSLTYFPFTAPTMLMIRLGGGSDMSAGEITAALVIVAVTGLVLLWIAAPIFRANILLSGQRVTPRNGWTALCHAD
ncbi:MAG: ABC transporter permease [Actinomycetia bacterium]|nr:ABC transporter permease [Actinomycetes bacterium]